MGGKVNRDCKNCEHCNFIWGFMCNCTYSYKIYDEQGKSITTVGVDQDKPRNKARICEFYVERGEKE